MTDLQLISNYLANRFEDQPEKITFWWFTKNENFGDYTPAEFMILRPKKMAKWVKYSMEMNGVTEDDFK